jgi:hypothetical protein
MIHTDGTPTIAWADDAPGIHPDDYRAPVEAAEPTFVADLNDPLTCSRVLVRYPDGGEYELGRFLHERDADKFLKVALESRAAPANVWAEHP